MVYLLSRKNEVLRSQLLGCVIVATILFVVATALKVYFVYFFILQGHLKMHPEMFNGGFLDCNSLQILQEFTGQSYDDHRYFSMRRSLSKGMSEADLAKAVGCNGCFPVKKEPRYLLSRPHTCKRQNGDVSVLLLIKSATYNFDRRNTIRTFWRSNPVLASKSHLIRHVFFVAQTNESVRDRGNGSGRSVLEACDLEGCEKQNAKEKALASLLTLFAMKPHSFLLTDENDRKYRKYLEEAIIQDDVVIIDEFVDEYDKLLNKSVTALRWSMLHCSEARFVVLMDDDTVVFLDRLLDLLDKFQSTPLFLGGNRMYGEPNRDETSKWYISPKGYPHERAPDFYNGALFVMGNDTVAELWRVVTNLSIETLGPQLDDFILTGFARALAGIADRHICNFSIGHQPWRIRHHYDIQPWTVAMLSTPQTIKKLMKAFEKGKLASFFN